MVVIVDVEENVKLNIIDNVIFYVGDVKDILIIEFVEKYGKLDLLIIDFFWVGMYFKVVEMFKELVVFRMVYVSCNLVI